jgi:hypothetical protein
MSGSRSWRRRESALGRLRWFKAVADDQHADHQLRIDRRPANGTVKRRQLAPQLVEFNKPINRPQQVSFRNMPFQRKLIKQRVLLDLPLPHHRLPPSRRDLRK